jgi:hypothetical protein
MLLETYTIQFLVGVVINFVTPDEMFHEMSEVVCLEIEVVFNWYHKFKSYVSLNLACRISTSMTMPIPSHLGPLRFGLFYGIPYHPIPLLEKD